MDALSNSFSFSGKIRESLLSLLFCHFASLHLIRVENQEEILVCPPLDRTEGGGGREGGAVFSQLPTIKFRRRSAFRFPQKEQKTSSFSPIENPHHFTLLLHLVFSLLPLGILKSSFNAPRYKYGRRKEGLIFRRCRGGRAGRVSWNVGKRIRQAECLGFTISAISSIIR